MPRTRGSRSELQFPSVAEQNLGSVPRFVLICTDIIAIDTVKTIRLKEILNSPTDVRPDHPTANISNTNFPDDPLSSLSSSVDDPMSMSYHERRVLAKEKAKVFEEETRAVLEKKAFRSRDQKMSREQTERRWQEVKRQATLLTRDNSEGKLHVLRSVLWDRDSCLPALVHRG